MEPLDSLVLNESKVSFINRHVIADVVEEELSPLQESDNCTKAVRRASRMKSIGRYATMKECATFISNNKYLASENKYVPRESPLKLEEVQEKMKSILNRVSCHIKKVYHGK